MLPGDRATANSNQSSDGTSPSARQSTFNRIPQSGERDVIWATSLCTIPVFGGAPFLL
jgi:hypothetical protein